MTMKYYSQKYPLKYGSKGAAGIDLPYYDEKRHKDLDKLPKWKRWFKERKLIIPFKRYKLPTGVHVEMTSGEYGEIDTRSSTSKKFVVMLCRTIDEDYRGNIHVVFFSIIPWIIKAGEYKFQMVVKPYHKKELLRQPNITCLSNTERGQGGFGSTDKKEVK